jgi:type IV secretion system protein TrbL
VARPANDWIEAVVSRRFILLAVTLLLAPIAAHAQGVAGQAVDQALGQIMASANAGTATFQNYATNTFLILASLQLGWKFIKRALSNRSLEGIVETLVLEIFMVGFFYWLLTTTTTWGPAIIQSFRTVAGATGAAALTPGDVANQGINIAGRILAAMSFWDPGPSVGLALAGVVILACFAFAVMQMVLTLGDSYYVVSMGQLFMAFGANEMTNDIAINVIRTVFATGAKLFALQVLCSAMAQTLMGWVNIVGTNPAKVSTLDLAVEILTSIIFAGLVKGVPERIERMAGGSGVGSHAGVSMAAAGATAGGVWAAGQMAGRAGSALTGAATAATAATRLAETQVARQASLGMGSQSTAGRIASTAGLTAKALAQGVGRDIGRRVTGQALARGQAGFRIANDIRGQEQQLTTSTPSLGRRP